MGNSLNDPYPAKDMPYPETGQPYNYGQDGNVDGGLIPPVPDAEEGRNELPDLDDLT